MKILHLATDDKFLDHAFPVFEKVFPDSNEVIVFASSNRLKYVKMNPHQIETTRRSMSKSERKLANENYQNYDLVVLHSLQSSICTELQNIPQEIPIIWLGWGFDYYNNSLVNIPLFMKKTKAIYVSLRGNGLRKRISAFIKTIVRSLNLKTKDIRAIERISIFSPVLPSEYDLVANSRSWKHFPKFGAWNYGTMEDNLIKGFEGANVDGNAILLGNSATFTGNHTEALDLLCQLGIQDRLIVSPLSYGNKEYAQMLAQIGKSYFGDNFEPLMDFMPIEAYLAIIKKCGYVIMNHVRQQAVGNIVIMLYLGARVFVRQENPVYKFFKDMGASISTVQQLEANSKLIETPLTAKERAKNRLLVSDYWSQDRAYERTQELVEKAMSLGNVKGRETVLQLDK